MVKYNTSQEKNSINSSKKQKEKKNGSKSKTEHTSSLNLKSVDDQEYANIFSTNNNEEFNKNLKKNLDMFNEENAKKYEDQDVLFESPIDNLNKSKKDKKAKGFRSFNLSQEILEGIKRIGYKMPTPIQRKCIPSIMSGFNIISHSRTGSGKTAAFVLPILHRLKEHSKIVGSRCIIVCPTRELAHQTMTFCKKLGKFTNLKYTLLVGGNELEGQFERLAQNPDIIIATPGRIMHHLVIILLNIKSNLIFLFFLINLIILIIFLCSKF